MRYLKITYLQTFVLVIFLLPQLAVSKDYYGEKPQLSAARGLDDLIDNFPSIANKTVLVKGEVKNVCQKKGCWMMLTDRNNAVRVRFKDYGFFVPITLQNKQVLVQGRLFKKTETVDNQKHYLQDQGASQAEINKVSKDKITWQFVASGVELI